MRPKLTQGELIDLDEAAEAVIREAGAALREKWSDAARAAALAARRAKSKGGDWRQAGRAAYRERITPGLLAQYQKAGDTGATRRSGSGFVANVQRAVSGKAAQADAQASAKRLMDKRREVMAQQKAAAASDHPLDRRLAKMHGDKLAAIDRVGAKLAPKIKHPRREAFKSAGRQAGQFLKRLFFK